MTSIHSRRFVIVGTALAAMLAGCGPSQISVPSTAATGNAKGAKLGDIKSDAGLPVSPDANSKAFQTLVDQNKGRKDFTMRGDPFELTSSEKSYDYSQESERVFTGLGGFPTYVEPHEETAPQVQNEPQPYRRLEGVVVGDSVVALILMGPGEDPVLIRPGMKIPNSPWTVVSIDQDKAILRRGGDTLPKEIQVRLETPPPGTEPIVTPTGSNTGGPQGFGPGFGGGRRGGPAMGGVGAAGGGGGGGVSAAGN